MSLDSTIHADATVAPHSALPTSFAIQVPSVESDRKVPITLRQSGSTPVEMLISTRVRKSPFWHLSHAAGCWRATVYNRTYHPRGYVRPEDGGAMAEYEALVNHVTMWNVAVERQIRVKGGRNKSSAKSYAKVERSRNVMRHALAQPGGEAT